MNDNSGEVDLRKQICNVVAYEAYHLPELRRPNLGGGLTIMPSMRGWVGTGDGNQTMAMVQVVLSGAVCYLDVKVYIATKNGGGCATRFKRMWADNGARWWFSDEMGDTDALIAS